MIATNAIHAAIAAADVICCIALRERSADGSHATAIHLLARVDSKLANALSRCVDRKTQAAYESRDIATGRHDLRPLGHHLGRRCPIAHLVDVIDAHQER